MIQKYINSGILETYVMGIASEEEVRELMRLKAAYPEVNDALQQLEADMERIAGYMAIPPPPDTWNKIEQEINGLSRRQNLPPERLINKNNNGQERLANAYIEVESDSIHMRIRKTWRWVFAAVFILAKVFLAFAIYFYLENRQARIQLQELKTEIRQFKKQP